MSIQKITDAEIAAASISRLSDRPNEDSGYGERAMSADELKAAFDALGKLNAARYNEFVGAVTSGELYEALRTNGGKTAESAATDIADGHIASHNTASDAHSDIRSAVGAVQSELTRTASELKSKISGVNVSLSNSISATQSTLHDEIGEAKNALSCRIDDLKEAIPIANALTVQMVDADTACAEIGVYKDKVADGNRLTFTQPYSAGPILAEFSDERVMILAGSVFGTAENAEILLCTFPVKQGKRYFVCTEESSEYLMNGGYITDGYALTVHIGDKVYRAWDTDGSYVTLYNDEGFCFDAMEDGTAKIYFSAYNDGMLDDISEDIRITPLVYDATYMLPAGHARKKGGRITGYYRHAEGQETSALNTGAHAEGIGTTAVGAGAHAEGCNTAAQSEYTHAEGYGTGSGGYAAHAEGQLCRATGSASHAEGKGTAAKHAASHAGGYYTVTGADYQTVIGRFNADDTDALLIVGAGIRESERKNAFAVGTKNEKSYITLGNVKITEEQLESLLKLI